MLTRQQGEEREAAFLAPFAMRSRDSRGRRHPEPEHPFRLVFQRDRDRIIHSTAFRRLEYKTQVFVNHEGDYYRTRLTHTMEAAQVTRTIARALSLNEDLAETVALAHDLGHTPFGHAGERTLNRLMQPYGGFEHNAQSLRIVDVLEDRYPGFHGLNLSWEVLEGIVKHSTRYDRLHVRDFEPEFAPTLEAQIVDFADEIAYNAHDIDDGLKSGMLEPADLDGVTLWTDTLAAVTRRTPQAPLRVLHYQAVRAVIDAMVTDLVEAVEARLQAKGIATLPAVRAVKPRLIDFSDAMTVAHLTLKGRLYERLYTHQRVTRMTQKADRIMTALFDVYMHEPKQMPPHVFQRVGLEGETVASVVADYIAGMTDRYALEEYKKLFDPYERV